jgi:ribosome biogenesis GTPase A
MPRHKGFSGAQKKEYLKAKRMRKREEGKNDDDEEDNVGGLSEARAGAALGVPASVLEASLGRSSANGSHLSTIFAKESRAVVEARRAASARALNVAPRDAPLRARRRLNDDPALDHPRGILLRAGKRGRGVYLAEDARAVEEADFSRWLSGVYARYARDDLNTFEHNIDVWMQLWHTLATADVVCIVADVRNPLWHVPQSLYRQVVEELGKPLVVVLNKCDLVPRDLVDAWLAFLAREYPLARFVPFTASGADLVGAGALTLAVRRRLLRAARTAHDDVHIGRRVASARGLLEAAGVPAAATAVVENRLRATYRKPAARGDVELSVGAGVVATKAKGGTTTAAPAAGEDDGTDDGGGSWRVEEEEDSEDEDEDEESATDGAAAPGASASVTTAESDEEEEEEDEGDDDDDGGAQERAASDGGASDSSEEIAAALKAFARNGRGGKAAAQQQQPRVGAVAGAGGGKGRAASPPRGPAPRKAGSDDDDDGLDRFAGRPRHYKRGDAGKKLLEIESGFRKGGGGGGGASSASAAPSAAAEYHDAGGGGKKTSRKSKAAKAAAGGAAKPAGGRGKAKGADGDGDDDEAGPPVPVGPSERALAAAEATAASAPSVRRPLTIGMVGHPNVGKSSVINALCGEKRVSVSRTAGHTKRAQTIHLVRAGEGLVGPDEAVDLLDCPGLAFPHAMVPPPERRGPAGAGTGDPSSSLFAQGGDKDERAMQECCGVIPLAQVREPYTSIRFLASHLPIERLYGISLPKDETREEGGEGWTPLNICEALATKRGLFIARTGRPDSHSAGRSILYDTQDGIVPLWWLPPAEGTGEGVGGGAGGGGPGGQGRAAAEAPTVGGK